MPSIAVFGQQSRGENPLARMLRATAATNAAALTRFLRTDNRRVRINYANASCNAVYHLTASRVNRFRRYWYFYKLRKAPSSPRVFLILHVLFALLPRAPTALYTVFSIKRPNDTSFRFRARIRATQTIYLLILLVFNAPCTR